MVEHLRSNLRAWSAIAYRQRRRKWSRLLDRASIAIEAGLHDPCLEKDLRELAEFSRGKGRHAFATVLQAAAEAIEYGEVNLRRTHEEITLQNSTDAQAKEANPVVKANNDREMLGFCDSVRYAIRKEASDIIGQHAPNNKALEHDIISALIRREKCARSPSAGEAPRRGARAMKLFVWQSPYEVGYGASIVYAVAETVEAAREQAVAGIAYSHGMSFDDIGLDHPRVPLGEPTRVLNLPCAEWHEWAE